MFGLVRKFFKFIRDQGFSRFLLLLLMDNPRCLHIYIPFSRKEKRGREVQVAPFKNGSRKLHIATSIYIPLAELCHMAIPGAGQAGQD